MEAKYQVGDIVTIKQLITEDDISGKYRFGLNSEMIESSGESFKIKNIDIAAASPGKLPDDGYRYRLEGSRWSWASSMFKDKDDEQTLIVDALSSSHSSKSDNDISAFIRTKKRPELDFNL